MEGFEKIVKNEERPTKRPEKPIRRKKRSHRSMNIDSKKS